MTLKHRTEQGHATSAPLANAARTVVAPAHIIMPKQHAAIQSAHEQRAMCPDKPAPTHLSPAVNNKR